MLDDLVAGVAELAKVKADHGAGAVETVQAVDEGAAIEQQAVYADVGAGSGGVDGEEFDVVGLAYLALGADGDATSVAAIAVEADDGADDTEGKQAIELVGSELCGSVIVQLAGYGADEFG